MNRAERRQGGGPSRAELQAQAQRRRTILFASLGVMAVLLLVAVGVASRVPKVASEAPIYAQLKVGDKAPEFAVSTTGGPFDLAGAGGKPTLLEVYATWCPHCQRETVTLNRLYDAYRGNVNIVAVSGSPYGIDESSPESQADVVDFMQRFSVRYPIAFDPNLDVAKKYLQGGFPTLVLIGKDGTILGIRDGEIPSSDLSAALDAAVAGRHVDPHLGAKA
ncbi:MAG: TlpA disulfide reductase family protein [Candidatus Baltobacteraceae bacterium]|jgi:thiol-disulfide isomerase/thioredoxin